MIGWLLCPAAFGLDLDEARERAMAEALGVQRQQALTQAASAEALQAVAANLPQIGAFAAASSASGPNPFGRFSSTQLEVGAAAQWTLLSPAGWSAAFAARRSARGQRALLQWAVATARRDATIAYADAQVAVETVDALARAEQDAARMARGVASLVAAGLRPEADRARTAAAAEALAADRVAAEGEVAASCAALQSLLGLPIDGHCSLTPIVAWHNPGTAPGPQPALVAAEEAARAAREAFRGSLLDAAPVIRATASASQSVGSAVVGDSDPRDLSGLALSAGVRADLPLLGSGLGAGRVRAADAAHDAAEIALEAQRRELEVGHLSAEARHHSAVAAVAARVRSVSAAEEALGLVDARYREGLDSLEAWLLARRALDEARVALAEARARLGRALAELEAVRGIDR